MIINAGFPQLQPLYKPGWLISYTGSWPM